MTINILAVVRVTLASHPVASLLCVMVLLAAIRAAVPGLAAAPVHRAITAAALVVVVGFAAITGWYASQLAYFDPAEPTITAVAAVFADGHPLYPALDAPERYAHVYGPVLFIVHAAALTLFGPSIAASKAVGVTAILLSLLAGAWLVAARRGMQAGLWAAAACATVYLAFGNVTFWTRGDPLLILLVVAGLVAAAAPPGRLATWSLAVILGVSLNVKMTGPLYLLPVVALALRDRGWRAGLAILPIAAVVGAAPFAWPSVSLTHYLEYLALSARNGVSFATLRQNMGWALFLCAPLARRFQSPDPAPVLRTSVFWLGGALVLVSLAAAKPGGGPFHLLPFVPTVVYLFAVSPRAEPPHWSSRLAAPSVVIVALIIAVAAQALFIRTVQQRDLRQASAEVRTFMQQHPGGAPAIGYAGTSHLSFIRPEAVFGARSYLLDAPAVQEHQLAGLAIPASTIAAIASCVVPAWLIPANGEQPFLVPSAYAPQGPPTVFSAEFRATFERHYERTSSTGLFDVWTCRAAPVGLQKFE